MLLLKATLKGSHYDLNFWSVKHAVDRVAYQVSLEINRWRPSFAGADLSHSKTRDLSGKCSGWIGDDAIVSQPMAGWGISKEEG